VTGADIGRLFVPEDFTTMGQPREEETGHPWLRLIYESDGVS
jgi:hypothetical protein